MVMLSARSSIS
ncbi:UNVERIFIED_CONTAM: hypothetical protein GTU68_003240 [Idotea baltica]|nr:hypothetical protein [Idotea baltica]